MSQELQNISLRIDCYNIPMKVRRDEEEIWRKAAVMLNDTYRRYATAYMNKNVPIEKLWIYTALDIAVQVQRDYKGKDMEPVLDKLQQLNSLIEKLQQQ